MIDPANIIDWYRDNARDLPWRRPGTTPWGVLLSEVMSHQTPVARVAPIWEEWIARWPTPADLAAAPTDDVLRAWGTLGYPRRALRLKECAQSLVDDHHGRVPSSVDSLLALPGIGDYTARAVAAFAYGQAVPVVDTNVRRVYARAVAGRPLARPQKAELEWVAALLPTAADSADAAGHAHPADSSAAVFSAGLMELGATVCTAANPACGTCPLLDSCAWVAAGSPAPTEEELARRKVQKFAGTDRQVRGKILKVLREASGPVPQAAIDIVWPDDAQRSRALYSLLDDGLAVQDSDGQFRLP
ncbi:MULTISPECIES: A/G-specific adenine glycosylase [unclassified Corynebacterium]|uniref:A/G-specific adenine glycosylase n=1 Tax=unclassified Corynebacterium TaxID=2624378 RepID=UPI00264D55B6|nr:MULTISPECIES: A/G-specific adenine glycosylase [unclassified Corynebacterium]MDN8595034.1 A/G-specific adenine glycosylase [Corynebacterium sp. P4_F2]WKK55425.1 A/G-specific adenine glycosylase [Corynebacterium sp. P4-C1]WKK62834.1 A/G-specific adenine glycosylase [Corynebacterium sp. P8-C1]